MGNGTYKFWCNELRTKEGENVWPDNRCNICDDSIQT